VKVIFSILLISLDRFNHFQEAKLLIIAVFELFLILCVNIDSYYQHMFLCFSHFVSLATISDYS